MATPTVKLIVQDGNDVREMTVAEYTQYELDLAADKAQAKADTEKAKQKQAVLDRLGITADEAALLLG